MGRKEKERKKERKWRGRRGRSGRKQEREGEKKAKKNYKREGRRNRCPEACRGLGHSPPTRGNRNNSRFVPRSAMVLGKATPPPELRPLL